MDRAKSFAVPDERSSPTPPREDMESKGGDGDSPALQQKVGRDPESENGDGGEKSASAFALVFYVRLKAGLTAVTVLTLIC